MPVIDNRGKPLPKDHPFAGGRIIFGIKPPPNWKENLKKQREAEKKKLESQREEGQDHAET